MICRAHTNQNAGIPSINPTDHLILVLNKQLDTLDGGSGSLGNGLPNVTKPFSAIKQRESIDTHRRHTTHHEID